MLQDACGPHGNSEGSRREVSSNAVRSQQLLAAGYLTNFKVGQSFGEAQEATCAAGPSGVKI
jgi:hypothetical protein